MTLSWTRATKIFAPSNIKDSWGAKSPSLMTSLGKFLRFVVDTANEIQIQNIWQSPDKKKFFHSQHPKVAFEL